MRGFRERFLQIEIEEIPSPSRCEFIEIAPLSGHDYDIIVSLTVASDTVILSSSQESEWHAIEHNFLNQIHIVSSGMNVLLWMGKGMCAAFTIGIHFGPI